MEKLSASRLAKCLDNEHLAFLFDFILNSGNKHRSYTCLAIRAFRQLTGDLAKQAHAFLDENIAIARSNKCRHEHIFTLVILSRGFGFSQQSANFCKTQLKTQHHNLIDYFFICTQCVNMMPVICSVYKAIYHTGQHWMTGQVYYQA
ncbi:MAG: hypothetical protein CSA47_02470 [Gammaproteobacteria bacterium]|nr:MAG: hypothetical protein CSA47_02470 [Gammaproteobacteria bacterium]